MQQGIDGCDNVHVHVLSQISDEAAPHRGDPQPEVDSAGLQPLLTII